jgi:osmotically-inducible protein OsmY
MKSFFAGLFIGILLLGAAVWYYSDKNAHAHAAAEEFKNAARDTKDFVKEKVGSLNLSTDNIKEEMSRLGHVVRDKTHAAGKTVAEDTADGRTTAAIKGKLLADPNLSAVKISVTTMDGRVALSGSASSPENIQKAIQLAWDTDGVKEVDSTLQVKE